MREKTTAAAVTLVTLAGPVPTMDGSDTEWSMMPSADSRAKSSAHATAEAAAAATAATGRKAQATRSWAAGRACSEPVWDELLSAIAPYLHQAVGALRRAACQAPSATIVLTIKARM